MARKPTREKFKTLEGVFDEKTRYLLYKLSGQGYFEELKSPLSVGKEARVFSAVTKEGDYVAIKIYRVNNCDFFKMHGYLRADPRFMNVTKRRRAVIFAWAKREYRNLLLARKAGVRVPKPLVVRDNVLIMEFIGNGSDAAFRLKDDYPVDAERFYSILKKEIKRMYDVKGGLVHGDLSEFNILNFNGVPVVIDLSHGACKNYPNFDDLIERDIKVVNKFFNRLGVKDKYEDVKKWILDMK